MAPSPVDAEASFVTRLRAGDEAAFEQLVREQAGRLFALARRILRNPEEAQDAVQDAFVSAHRALDGFAETASLSTWLHRIVVNTCLMRLRARKRLREESLDGLLPQFLDDGHHAATFVPWAASPHDEAEKAQRRALVRGCMDELPETHRTVLVLRDLEELDTRETAGLLGITENAVKIRLHRARQALRTLLDRQLNPGVAS